MNQLLPWQQKDWTRLNSYSQQKRIPQALLITGKKGVGKQVLAKQFTYSLLCATPAPNGLACGVCQSCLLLKAETHPDYISIKPDEPGKAITIDQIRSLITNLTLKPQFDKYRIVNINPADLMNVRAENAFLKCLEEPNERTVIILITDRPAKLPATIVSRCQKFAITAPDKETVFSWLKNQTSQNNLELPYGLAQGAPLIALEYLNNETLALRNESFNCWLAVAKKQKSVTVIAENWCKLPESPLVFWITSWVIDLIKCHYRSKTEHLYNPDLRQSLQELSQGLELKGLYNLYDLLLMSRQRLETQINKQLMFEEILIQWTELNRNK